MQDVFDFWSRRIDVLKASELRLFGEYRTRRLVLQAWDRQHANTDAGESPPC